MNTIGIITSGGDSPGMNSAIRAITKSALAKGMKVIGVQKGYLGLHEKRFVELTAEKVEDIYRKGGTILYTARYPAFNDQKVIDECAQNCREAGIEGMVVIGGDGSFRGARDLTHAGIPCVCLPGTIDNDIVCSEDTIGFDSSMNIISNCINMLRDTTETLDRCSVIEVMGAGAGWMALEGGIATGADVILVPEVKFDFEKDVVDVLKAKKAKGQNYFMVVIAECVFFPAKNSKSKKNVNFEYVNANGLETAAKFASKIQEATGIESRATVLGHIQRGGAPSFHDCVLATDMGIHAVNLLAGGISKRVVVSRGGKIVDLDIDEGLSMEKPFNAERLKTALEVNA